MNDKTLYIIAGCNGAGKTTASFTVLPELLQVKEFVNADEIARGLSPFQPELVAIEAGKIMLRRIEELIRQRQDFAFETMLSTRSFVQLCSRVRQIDYTIHLIFFWLDSPELAIKRVKQRVSEGGHDVPAETVFRRYRSGIKNFLNLYRDAVDYWLLFDNSDIDQELIAEKYSGEKPIVYNVKKWQNFQKYGQS